MLKLVVLSVILHLALGQRAYTKLMNEGDDLLYNDCHQIFKAGYRTQGTYRLKGGRVAPCEFDDTNGYTVILRRVGSNVDFHQSMNTYKYDFGTCDDNGDYWHGLGNIHHLSLTNNTYLEVTFTDWDDNLVHVDYQYFYIDGETDGYTLHTSLVTRPTHPPGIFDSIHYNNGMPFRTYDVKDLHHCVDQMKGGWWYNHCSETLPTGRYYPGGYYNKTTAYYWDGIFWNKYKGYNYSLKTFNMRLTHSNSK